MPITRHLMCPTCGAPSLKLVLKASWGDYYGCPPCGWSMFAAERIAPNGCDMPPALLASASSNATPASGHNTIAG